jgi:hypothetical protein
LLSKDSEIKFINLLTKKKEFINLLTTEKPDEFSFLFLFETLQYPEIVSILINYGYDYSINDYELFEISIIKSYYETVDIFVKKYPELYKIFEWGYERKNNILLFDNYKRMSKYYIINLTDDKMKLILIKNRHICEDLLIYKKKISL